jgi:uncharacterized Tic20 family protein
VPFLPLGAIALTRHLVSGSAQADFAIDSFWTTGADVALTVWLSPYLELVVGLGCWLLLGRGHSFVRYHLRQVLKFQITSVVLSTLVIGLIGGMFYWIDAADQNIDYVAGWLLLGLIIGLSPPALIFRVLCILIVGVEAYRGVRSYYPFYWPWR